MILTLRDPVGAWQSTMPTALKNWNGGESEIFSCQRSPQMTLLKTTDDCPVSVPLPVSAITDYFHVYCLCQLPPPTQTIHCWWCAWNLNYRGTFGGEALILTLFILSYRTTSDMLKYLRTALFGTSFTPQKVFHIIHRLSLLTPASSRKFVEALIHISQRN